MDWKVRLLNRALKTHDRDLFSRRESNGAIHVYRKGVAWQQHDLDGATLIYSFSSPQFVFALTENWRVNGKSIDIGTEVVMAKVKASDLWNRESMSEELIKSYEEDKASVERDRVNNVEAFLYDQHRNFKKAFSDINVSNLAK